jgi:membrane protein implicated in regulation of membrane protease activity
MTAMWADPPEDPPGPGNSWLPLLGALVLAIVMLWIAGGATEALIALAAVLVVAFVVSTRRRRRAHP